MKGPFNPFICHGELEDEKIMMALRQAVNDYENGEVAEVHDLLIDIIDAIEKFEDNFI